MKTRLWGAACASVFTFVCIVAQAVPVSGQGTWETTLLPRDLTGDGVADAYYDTTLDITWLADANVAGNPLSWEEANAWVTGLNINGVTGWRLPTNTPINGTSYQIIDTNNASTDFGYADSAGWVDASGNPVSEMGHMFYVTLGNLGECTPNDADPTGCIQQAGFGLTNTGPFSNMTNPFSNFNSGLQYWSGSDWNPTYGWLFDFSSGLQFFFDRTDSAFFAWAVRSGDVGTVPVPAAVWLFGSGLVGLLGIARHKR